MVREMSLSMSSIRGILGFRLGASANVIIGTLTHAFLSWTAAEKSNTRLPSSSFFWNSRSRFPNCQFELSAERHIAQNHEFTSEQAQADCLAK